MPDEPPYISVLDQLRVPDVPAKAELPVEEPPKKEPEKKDDPKPEPVAEPKKATRAPSSPEGKEDFRKLSETAKAAEKKATELESKLSESQKKITEMEAQLAELPQTKEAAAKLQQQIEEREEALQKLNQEFQHSREELKAANLQRDPEFVEKFEKGREFHVNQIRDLAATRSVPENDVLRALQGGNEDRLAEIREQLTPGQQRRWDVTLEKLEALEIEKQQELQDSDKAWERLQEGRRKQAMKSRAELYEAHRAMGAEIINGIRESVPFFREDKELQQQVSEIAEAVAGGKGADQWDSKKLIGTAVAVPVLMRVNALQAKKIEEETASREAVEKERDELKKKVEDQDEFIKQKYGSIDFRQPAAKNDSNGEWDPNRPIHEQIAVRRS